MRKPGGAVSGLRLNGQILLGVLGADDGDAASVPDGGAAFLAQDPLQAIERLFLFEWSVAPDIQYGSDFNIGLGG